MDHHVSAQQEPVWKLLSTFVTDMNFLDVYSWVDVTHGCALECCDAMSISTCVQPMQHFDVTFELCTWLFNDTWTHMAVKHKHWASWALCVLHNTGQTQHWLKVTWHWSTALLAVFCLRHKHDPRSMNWQWHILFWDCTACPLPLWFARTQKHVARKFAADGRLIDWFGMTAENFAWHLCATRNKIHGDSACCPVRPWCRLEDTPRKKLWSRLFLTVKNTPQKQNRQWKTFNSDGCDKTQIWKSYIQWYTVQLDCTLLDQFLTKNFRVCIRIWHFSKIAIVVRHIRRHLPTVCCPRPCYKHVHLSDDTLHLTLLWRSQWNKLISNQGEIHCHIKGCIAVDSAPHMVLEEYTRVRIAHSCKQINLKRIRALKSFAQCRHISHQSFRRHDPGPEVFSCSINQL